MGRSKTLYSSRKTKIPPSMNMIYIIRRLLKIKLQIYLRIRQI
jgi:hypothetical protein